MNVTYKITYPNGKIYIGQDRTNSIHYYGSPKSKAFEKDFTPEQRRKFTVTREILWESETVPREEVNAAEVRFILQYRSNDPAIGYNLTPKFKGKSATE